MTAWEVQMVIDDLERQMGPTWFSGLHTASDGTLWLSEESAAGYETQLEEAATAEQQQAECETVNQNYADIFVMTLDGDLTTTDTTALVLTNDQISDHFDC